MSATLVENIVTVPLEQHTLQRPIRQQSWLSLSNNANRLFGNAGVSNPGRMTDSPSFFITTSSNYLARFDSTTATSLGNSGVGLDRNCLLEWIGLFDLPRLVETASSDETYNIFQTPKILFEFAVVAWNLELVVDFIDIEDGIVIQTSVIRVGEGLISDQAAWKIETIALDPISLSPEFPIGIVLSARKLFGEDFGYLFGWHVREKRLTTIDVDEVFIP